MDGGATIREPYRYHLWRVLAHGAHGCKSRVLFVMLNPSTADADRDDPTLRRCIGFAKAWGFGRLDVCNLFALRTPDPRDLRRHPNPIGPANDRHLRAAAERADLVVAAWGTAGGWLGRAGAVRSILEPKAPVVLRLTRDGHPAHPLYLPQKVEPFCWMNALPHSPSPPKRGTSKACASGYWEGPASTS
ncbi:MAG: DUF1643 domain-containing protein [Polyangiaceae bacterium]|nr:DUF1643 domain-containing protein [Polyangiaceae bacterium]